MLRVLIAGSGIAGLTLAYWLQRAGHQPVVCERAPHLRSGGYMLDFFGSGYDVAERMGMLGDLERIHYQIPFYKFVDGHGREELSIRYEAFRRFLDGRHFNFMRGELERLLYERIAGRVPVRFGAGVTAYASERNGVSVSLSDGTTERADLLVGADGVHSDIRRLTWGAESTFSVPLGYYTAAFIVEDLPAPGQAFYTLSTPGRQVAVYPIRGERLATFLIHRSTRTLPDLSRETALAELRTAYGDLGWIVPDLLERAARTPDLYFDTVEQIALPRWSDGRMTLAGDACQCVSLVAGQGASLAMLGGYVLARELAVSPDDLAAALRRYEATMRPVVDEKQRAGRRFAEWFVPSTPFRIWTRDMGFRMAGWPVLAPFIKRRFALGSSIKV